MIYDNYAKAYKEILEIFKYIPIEKVNKIPKDIIYVYTLYQDKNYNFFIASSESFNYNDLLYETKAILSNLYRDYWASNEKKAEILKIENYYKSEIEKQKLSAYPPNELFKNRKNFSSNTNTISNLPTSYTKTNFLKQLINYILKKFNS